MITTTGKLDQSITSEQKLVCEDYLVSGEKFEILPAEKGILKTFPVPENLEKYYDSEEYISHRDSSRNIQDKIYQFVKSYMLSKKANWIRAEIKHGNILDIGAGTGDFLNKMKSFLWKVEGVEPNKLARDLAILKGLDLKTDLAHLRDKKYDVISLWHVLEHLPDYEEKLEQFHGLLEDGGILVIAVPNYNSYDSRYYNENWAAWDVPRHLWHFSRKGLTEKLENKGFFLLKEKPLKFDSFYVSLLSEKNRQERPNIFNAVYRGLVSNIKAKKTGEYSSVAYFFQKRLK
ncbi:class I SAM-dependent methyltransferase [Gramella sp. KN1008]|uniref:class I SAM-dependent methyltransferase n=1 Tax=Gramella sp. KN1008 TaxID=2529298 RepID=UPI0010389320|nr:class I SAM-dependent methyltransferase [Gramella sp. KN1008]TBW27735.1 class I SAM-dependent methyltransferase [Gramella sp. KN1008]